MYCSICGSKIENDNNNQNNIFIENKSHTINLKNDNKHILNNYIKTLVTSISIFFPRTGIIIGICFIFIKYNDYISFGRLIIILSIISNLILFWIYVPFLYLLFLIVL